MSDLDETAILPPPTDNGGDPESPLTSLRARRKQIHRETTKDFPIPGFDGDLVCRYQVVPFEDWKRIERRNVAKVGPEKSLESAALDAYADQLIAACVAFYVKVNGELRPADPDEPVRYDSRLAAALGYQAESAREALRGLFVLAHGEQRAEWRIELHHTEVGLWIVGGADEDDDGAQGEAERTFAGES